MPVALSNFVRISCIEVLKAQKSRGIRNSNATEVCEEKKRHGPPPTGNAKRGGMKSTSKTREQTMTSKLTCLRREKKNSAPRARFLMIISYDVSILFVFLCHAVYWLVRLRASIVCKTR
ncbi:hypothetical protein CCR75_006850 [Bremia lactucae]|uniref:Transmembrane protein n=1 Tax=Bremia lactucae TaxID=4779 RepID=A0A976ILL7_BRELC|nr:hypothetical protein CCR75_006850 [Bremia lactucae]